MAAGGSSDIKLKKSENWSVYVTGSTITYVGHKIQTYQGTQTTGHHLSCLSQGPEWWWASHNELERKKEGIQTREF